MEQSTLLETRKLPAGHTLHRRPGRVRLTVCEGPASGTQVTVRETRIRGGRSRVNDLVIDDGSVSGAHFELRLGPGGVALRDLGSTNGTWVNGVRIREVWIEPGVVFHAGRCGIRLDAAEQVEVPISESPRFEQLIGASPAMREVFSLLGRVAPTPMDVLLGGETGTGKELAARAIHDRSPRRGGPFVVLDCAALPRELAESAILGHRKGAFTGAVSDRVGAAQDAHQGTLFLDEIGELPLDVQPKLLRVLERREVQRIGETRARPVDIRVIAATHRDLRQMVGDGKFREDLYFRLSDIRVELPPLRDRGDDILLIARAILDELAAQHGRSLTLTEDACAYLRGCAWPGNVRELRKTMRRAAFMAQGAAVERSDLAPGWREPALPQREDEARRDGAALDELCDLPFKAAREAFEREYLGRLMKDAGGNLSEAARRASYSRQGLRDLLKRLGIYQGDTG
ncbi:MAG: sigma 54-interacting transcriptional regulator [Myxococcales bacterium]|nr:sigma 54-interacting transcriptional regulator [Myxococcales bacterium]